MRGKNNYWWGLMLSLMVTLFGVALIYTWKYIPHNLTIQDFVNDLKYSNSKKSAVLSLALLANLPLMYFHQKRKLFKTLYGIGTILGIMALYVLVLKFNLV